jgi:hypothetical protein
MERKEKAASVSATVRGSGKASGTGNYPPPTASSQRVRLARYLGIRGKADTNEIRAKLGIMSPASRVLELRRAGLEILTDRHPETRVATYHLVKGGDL